MKLTWFVIALLSLVISCSPGVPEEKPNILWITCEDISPYLGCYGDANALTPNLDQLARQGIRYTHAYANAPVCGVARSTLLTGLYATSTGTHHMRSLTLLPEQVPAYPAILREAGYYCTNNSKTDYNSSYEHAKDSLWDECGKKAHWKSGPAEKPFFAVFNITVTHEGQLSEEAIAGYVERGQIPTKPRLDPDKIPLPPYHPDLPEIRSDWARFYDLITLMDQMVGDLLRELEEAGEAENTVVVFNSDHGGQLARSKRYIYNVGTQVPLIIYLPDKWRHLGTQDPGSSESRLVSFIDFPKTFLSITGCEVPEKMQGSVFLGNKAEVDPEYVHFFRDRMGSRYDFSRAVSDGRYYLVRNFHPHRPRGRDSRYGYWVQANWGAWERHFDAGNCNEIQSQFYQPKPAIEFFDTKTDPWHVHNLAEESGYSEKMHELSEELDDWMLETRDAGLIPESMFEELAGEGKKYATLYEFAQSPDYQMERILEIARSASKGQADQLEAYLGYLTDEDPIVRYWATYGLFLMQDQSLQTLEALKLSAKEDPFATNRLMAAQALGVCGNPDLAYKILYKEVSESKQTYLLLQGINAFQYSRTADRLDRSDWEEFKSLAGNIGMEKGAYGSEYSLRIINDALELWPDTRKVY